METFNNDNDKRKVSFDNLHEMIRLYCNTLKDILASEKGSRDILDDVHFLLMDHNENKMRSLFIKWNVEAHSMINSLQTAKAK